MPHMSTLLPHFELSKPTFFKLYLQGSYGFFTYFRSKRFEHEDHELCKIPAPNRSTKGNTASIAQLCCLVQSHEYHQNGVYKPEISHSHPFAPLRLPIDFDHNDNFKLKANTSIHSNLLHYRLRRVPKNLFSDHARVQNQKSPRR